MLCPKQICLAEKSRFCCRVGTQAREKENNFTTIISFVLPSEDSYHYAVLDSRSMASFPLNLLPAPQPSSHPRKLIETSASSTSLADSRGSRGNIGSLKPIVVTGNPPTFVSAPDRRIVAGSASFCSCFSDFPFCSTYMFSSSPYIYIRSYYHIYSAANSCEEGRVSIRMCIRSKLLKLGP